jgi:UDP-N-acetylmuramyl pentapeptide phosphotransferase/UDP-N-acetylglucosamine-1-phosphate transferase
MGGIFIIMTMMILMIISFLVQVFSPWIESHWGWGIAHSLWNRKETYIPIFTLMSVGIIGLLDDWLNIREI